jgi:hypothetical protein
MKRRIKLELFLAILMTVTIASLVIYGSLPKAQDSGTTLYVTDAKSASYWAQPATQGTSTQQIITENIQGELRKGEFETTVEGLKNLTLVYSGRIPNLHMTYDNELWSGTLKCKLPTDNVTWFTFEARILINDHGKVTHILIDVNEVEVNQTQTPEIPLSDISIYLQEYVENASPFMNQLGAVVPLLTTGLLWIAEGLIVAVPLCFACLGVVLVVSRGILPVWKRQFRNKTPAKEAAQSASK